MYGLTQDNVLIFGIAANVVAAIGALVLGRVEDRIGPKKVIMISLVGLLVTSVILLFSYGPTMFWVFGLVLTLCGTRSGELAILPRPGRAGRAGG